MTFLHTSLSLAAAALLFFIADPANADNCLKCHADIIEQMKGNSHHVQDTELTAKHCYACHWEATPEGRVDKQHHQSDTGRVDLVIWGQGSRPTIFVQNSSAISFSPAAIGTEKERPEIAKITRHCLACHSDSNNNSTTFTGDTKTPRNYAWDGQSIASRYRNRGVTPWGKYSTSTTNKKGQLVKAYSAHGNAGANRGGWSTTNGYDGVIPSTRGGASAVDVECYDCHNSHGSDIAGITASYPYADGSYKGGLLKQTIAGRNGYKITYTPTSNTNRQSSNPYNPGAGLCFDCHETETAGNTPWGFRTFGATQPIRGYKDTPRFGSGIKGSTSRYANRQGRSEIVSSHLKAGILLGYSTSRSINALCTPCHDPHGVSRTIGELMSYAVPLLKGTWLTSPYREDAPPAILPSKGRSVQQGNVMATGASGTTKGPVSMQGMKYSVDRNTFPSDGKIAESVKTFAGLCLNCHNRLISAGESTTARIHKAVKGWGENKEHSFPCSKCHQAHNSGLPRLMQTNCFEEGPAGLRDTIGLSWLPKSKTANSTTPATTKNQPVKNDFVGCHVRQFGKGGATPPGNNAEGWNEKTKW